MTHAVAALLHGNVAESVAFHPFAPLALAGLLGTAAGRTLPAWMWPRLAIGLGAFGGVRMLVAAL